MLVINKPTHSQENFTCLSSYWVSLWQKMRWSLLLLDKMPLRPKQDLMHFAYLNKQLLLSPHALQYEQCCKSLICFWADQGMCRRQTECETWGQENAFRRKNRWNKKRQFPTPHRPKRLACPDQRNPNLLQWTGKTLCPHWLSLMYSNFGQYIIDTDCIYTLNDKNLNSTLEYVPVCQLPLRYMLSVAGMSVHWHFVPDQPHT